MEIKNLNPKIKNPVLDRQKNIKMKDHVDKYDRFKNIPKEYLEVAEGMETQFVHKLVQEMRKSVPKSKSESSAEKYYQSLLDFEHAQKIAKHQGIGLKEVVLDQIYPQHKRQQDPAKATKMYRNISQSKEIGNE